MFHYTSMYKLDMKRVNTYTLPNLTNTVRSSVFVGFILRTNVTTLSDENLESAVRSWEKKPLEVTAVTPW
jgi:hypothetical protein